MATQPDSVREDETDNAQLSTPEQRNAEWLTAMRAAASSGKGNPPAAIDEFRARQNMNGFKAGAGAVLSDSEAGYTPSPAINEGRIQALPQFEECSGYLQTSLNCLSQARVALEQVNAAHEALRKDTSKTADQRLVLISTAAEKKFDAVYKSVVNAQEMIIKQIQSTEAELSKPLTTTSMTDAHKELRQVLRGMPKAERHKAIQDAIQSGDESIISAVLGSHPMATLVDPVQHQVWTRKINEKKSPEALRRLDAMKKSLEIVASIAPLIKPQFEAAMRGTFQKASAVRGLSDASAKALEAILGPKKPDPDVTVIN